MWQRPLPAVVFTGSLLVAACAAMYPELKTPLRPAQGELEPPPKDLRWIAFKGARVPEQTRDGRTWGALGGALPDPYAVLIVNGRVLIKTPVQSNTLTPTWPNAPAGNFWLRDTDRLRVELWSLSPVTDHPIGMRDLSELDAEARASGVLHVETSTGAEVEIAVEAAHAKKGLGLSYELRMGEVFISGMYDQCPASRAGLKVGDQVLELGGKAVGQMVGGEVQSILNAPRAEGVAVKVRHPDGRLLATTLKEGAIFPLYSEDGTLR